MAVRLLDFDMSITTKMEMREKGEGSNNGEALKMKGTPALHIDVQDQGAWQEDGLNVDRAGKAISHLASCQATKLRVGTDIDKKHRENKKEVYISSRISCS